MKRWFKYVKPYLASFILGPLCMIVEVVGEMLMPKYLSAIIDYGVKWETAVEINETPGWIQSLWGVIGHGVPFVAAVMIMMILTAVLMMLGGVGGAWFGAKASVNFATDLRKDVYEKVQTFSFANIDRFQTSSLVTRLTNDITQMQNFINMLLRMTLRAPGMLIGALIMAVAMNPSLTTVLAVTMPMMLVFIVVIILKSYPKFTGMQTRIDKLNNTVQENITNVRVVKSFVRQDHEKEKFARANGDLRQAGYEAMSLMMYLGPVMTFFMNATTIAVYWFGGRMVVGNEMTPGDLTAFITYISQILSSLMFVTMMFMNMSRAMASGRRIAEVLDEKADIRDENARFPEQTVARGAIEFRNVSFRYYKNSEDPVLNHVSFRVEAGQTVGIIGSTGCGKTTLVSLIPRLYDCDEGEVLVDGVNVKDYSLYHLREGVGMVLQKNILFSGSIADNLRWGNEEATEDDLNAAVKAAQADKFISLLSDGYETGLTQGGTNVSGGQKQRLCIARALLKKPKILILDDSTSAVDTATEAQIRQAFRNELKDTTKIIIAQRITSVMDADLILVMDNGKITGMGNHDSLMKENTEYQEIYASQMDKEA